MLTSITVPTKYTTSTIVFAYMSSPAVSPFSETTRVREQIEKASCKDSAGKSAVLEAAGSKNQLCSQCNDASVGIVELILAERFEISRIEKISVPRNNSLRVFMQNDVSDTGRLEEDRIYLTNSHCMRH